MIKMLSLWCLATMLVLVSGKSPPKVDDGRLFGGAYTKTVIETKVTTSLVPSSCVQVAATLPPCRNVRYLRFPKISGISFFRETNNEVNNQGIAVKSDVQSTPLGWGEYLGLYAPTVTVTETRIQTSTVQDPRTVVTFAVKGCRPLQLPMDLDRCSPESSAPVEDTSSIIQAVPSNWLTPSSTVASPTNTLYQKLPDDNSLPELRPEENFNLIEPSTQGSVEDLAGQQPTEKLTPTASTK